MISIHEGYGGDVILRCDCRAQKRVSGATRCAALKPWLQAHRACVVPPAQISDLNRNDREPLTDITGCDV